MAVVSAFLVWGEVTRWWRGAEHHTFAVERGVGQNMQINLDVVVKMACGDIHVNVQDASGDLILAGMLLKREDTSWAQWADAKGVHKLGRDAQGRVVTGAGYLGGFEEEGFGEEHVHDIVAAGKKKARWAKTPKLKGKADSCRVFGSMDVNKVQGDFHITARGHGYRGVGEHLDHSKFDFSHIISELSFGPFYPSLVNPLDRTVNKATANFHKFQYFLSVVPTIYSVGSKADPSHTILTNQYAVTEQSKEVTDHNIPGIFFKYDIEPVLLSVQESREGLVSFLIKIVNVLSGVLVACHWGFTLSDWAKDVLGKRRARSRGVIGEKGDEDE
ncbi:related to ERV41 - component of copii vesicles involved in transport between the ER and golgi complex [Cephalotrichum gorgonifer]|uniref:Endoplasmic reticulum-Golgi intermediate compartment protein n=1 Tax=Cephalotrichum gorgonifer TaxID=2041049 RepID=A0AAE8MQ83_9PEZI|nr:related to ERV41 - component of copii vesicles involved in transport between the ER and golgi complex [Cephalotrichum gorgonifer]